MIRKLFGVLILVGVFASGCNKAPVAPAKKANTKAKKAVKQKPVSKAGLSAPQKFTGTIAVVNGENLDADQLNRELARLSQNGRRKLPKDRLERVERSILKRLIDDMLIAQAADKQGIKVTEDEIQKAFEQYKSRFSSPKQFDTYIKRARMTKETIERWLKKKLILEKLLDKQGDLKISEDQAKKVYENNIRLYTAPERVQLQDILIKSGPKADATVKQVLAALAKGDAFVEVAKKYSQDTNKDKGGNMGWVRRGMLSGILEDAAFKLKPGTYTKSAIKTPKGFYILKCVDKKEKKVSTFDEVKDKIMASLRNRKVFTARLKLVKDLNAKAKIELKQVFAKKK